MTRNFLVTGAAGFIGRNVMQQLQSQGIKVSAIFNTPPDPQDIDNVTDWRDGGVTEANLSDLMPDCSVIIHCAGSGSVAHSLNAPAEDFQSNVVTMQLVLEAARRQGGVSVVFPSSAGVYGAVDTMPIRVDTPNHPVSPYGVNKLIAELLVQQYGRHFNVPATIVRLFSVYGPQLRKQLLWDACCKLGKGDALFFGTGEETRDWVHVEDAARLLIRAADVASPDCVIVNGGTGASVTIRRMIEGLAERMGIGAEIRFNQQTRAGDPKHYAADISEALATGWTPQKDLEQGLDDYVAWFLREMAQQDKDG